MVSPIHETHALARPTPPALLRVSTRPAVGTTDALLLAMSIIWGVNYVVVKYATTLLSPLAYNWMRVALATASLVALAALYGIRWPSRRDTIALLAVGGLGNGLYQVLFIEGVARTSAGNTALVLAAAPAFIALVGRVRGVERVRRRGFSGIAVSLLGIALLVLGSARSAGATPHLGGDLLVLAGCLCWSVYAVLVKPLGDRAHVLAVASLTLLGGTVTLLPFAARSAATVEWLALPAAAWWATLYSGILGLVVAYLFWYRGVRVLGPTRTAMYGNLQPIIALGAAWLALGEVPTVWQGVGAVLIFGGLVLTRS